MGRKIVLIATLLLALNPLAAQALKEPKFQGPLFVPGFNLGTTVATGTNMPVLLLPRGFSGQRVRAIYCDAASGTGEFAFAIRTGGPTAGVVRTIATGTITGPGHYAITVSDAVFTADDYTVYFEITSVTTPGLTGFSGVIQF